MAKAEARNSPAPSRRTLFGEPAALTNVMCDEYMRRMGLAPEFIRDKAAKGGLTLELLSELQVAHLLTVFFDDSMMHMQDEDFFAGPSEKPLVLGSGKGISCQLMDAFHAIVQQRRGGYCFVCNCLFAALLRSLGFAVSELAARVNWNRNSPQSEGYQWGPYSHMALFVNAGDERYLVDVGFGGGSSTFPIPLRQGARVHSLTPSESFEIRHEELPGCNPATFRDTAPGWTMYRHFAATDDRPAFESAVYHVIPTSLAPIDWEMLNYYNAHSPLATFANRLLVSILMPDGSRQTVQYQRGDEKVRYWRRDGQIGKVTEEELVEPQIGAIAELLKRKLNYCSRPRTISRIHSA